MRLPGCSSDNFHATSAPATPEPTITTSKSDAIHFPSLCDRLLCPVSVATGAEPRWMCVNHAPDQRRPVLHLTLGSEHSPIGTRELPGVPARDHLPCDLA